MEEEDGVDMKEEEVVAEVMTEVVVVEVEEGEDLVVMEVAEVDLKVDEEVRGEEDLEEEEEEEAIREEGAEVAKVQGASKGTRGTSVLVMVKEGPRGGEGVLIDICITSLS